MSSRQARLNLLPASRRPRIPSLTQEPRSSISHYRILQRLGEGGMGVVYRAFDEKLQREVALKVLRAEMATDPERLSRFEREARALAALNHPNIGTIYEIDEAEGITFIVMEMIQGRTLRKRIAGRPLSVDEVLDLGLQIAESLDAAHSRGIIHRDIKPPNILVTDRGQIKMLDFGLAKLTLPDGDGGDEASLLQTAHPHDHQVTTPGTTMGTIAYMSPEQVRGEELDARSDLFSFGAVLYEMTTGRCAFSAGTTGLTFDAILNRSPVPPDQIIPDIPGRLVEIIGRSLEKDRHLRYQTALDMRADLARVRRDADSGRIAATSGPARSAVVGVRSPLRRFWPGPARWVIPAALALLAVAVAVMGYFWLPSLLTRAADGTIDSIAVFPFEYVGDHSDGEYLSDGITEALINGLSKVPGLRVVPRSLVFPYKGQPFNPRKIGRELNVRAVVTGRVTQRGEDFSIAAELIDVAKVAQVWGQQYPRSASEAFTVPEEIARNISQHLRLRLSHDDEQRIARRYTDNPDAFLEYVKSLHQIQRGTRAEFDKAIASAQKAVVEDQRQRAIVEEPTAPGDTSGQKDPGFALAYAALARLYTQQSYIGHHSSEEAHTRARAAAEFALQMDNSLAEAHGALAFVNFFYESDWAAAEQSFRRALELGPNDDLTHRDYAWYLMAVGRKEQAIREMRRACELNAGSEVFSAQLAELLFWNRRDDEALVELDRTRRLAPDSPSAALVTAGILSRRGQHAEAIASYLDYLTLVEEESLTSPSLAYFYAVAGKTKEALSMVKRAAPGKISAAQKGWIYAALGENDEAFIWLGKAIDEHAASLVWIRAEPWFDPLRSDHRFQALLSRMNLPD